jgi:peptide deformylase
MINPEIYLCSVKWKDDLEGCLSSPKYYVSVRRPSWISVKWMD